MKILIYISLTIFCMPDLAFAQKVKPTASASSVFVAGVAGNSVGWEVAPGLSYKWLSAGAAVSGDRYEAKTYLFSGWLRAYRRQHTTSPFLYFQMGAAVPDRKHYTFSIADYSEMMHYKTGLAYELGLGYRVQIYRRLALNFSAGYSVKHTIAEVTWRGYETLLPPSYIPKAERREHTLRKMTFRTGLSF